MRNIHRECSEVRKSNRTSTAKSFFAIVGSLHKIYCSNDLQQNLNKIYRAGVQLIEKVGQRFFVFLNREFYIFCYE